MSIYHGQLMPTLSRSGRQAAYQRARDVLAASPFEPVRPGGGPIGLARDGDTIGIDANTHKMYPDVDQPRARPPPCQPPEAGKPAR